MHKGIQIKWINGNWFFLAAFVVLIDQLTKTWAMQHLQWGEAQHIFFWLDFRLAFNTGAAYSFLHTASGWQNIFFIVLAALVSIWIVFTILTDTNPQTKMLHAGFSLIMGGALANAWDRIQHQAVIDFINPHWGNWYFAIFNVADSAITLGAMCLIWTWWFARNLSENG
jgi:signal peptidase II